MFFLVAHGQINIFHKKSCRKPAAFSYDPPRSSAAIAQYASLPQQASFGRPAMGAPSAACGGVAA
jgi:hypothetical protein